MPNLGNDTKFRTTIGFAIWIISTIITIVLAYSSMRAELTATISELHRLTNGLQQQDRLIRVMREQQIQYAQKLDDFRQSYEHDMQRYVRERGDRGRPAHGE